MAKVIGGAALFLGTGLISKIRSRRSPAKAGRDKAVERSSTSASLQTGSSTTRTSAAGPGDVRTLNEGSASSWRGYFLQRMLPFVLALWIIFGVIPAAYFRMRGQTERLGALLPLNMAFTLLCACWWCMRAFSYMRIHIRRRDYNLAAYPNNINPSMDYHYPTFERTSRDIQHPRNHKPVVAQQLKGRYVKSKEESDQDAIMVACEAINLNWMMKRAIGLIRGMDIDISSSELKISLFSFVPWFKIRENYSWDGTERSYTRRDFRGGKSIGTVQARGPSEVEVTLTWGHPYEGSEKCVLKLQENKLISDTTMVLRNGQVYTYRQVFIRTST